MHGHHVTIEPRQATRPGALDGFAIRCSCGDVQTASLDTIARAIGEQHLLWHATRELEEVTP